MKFKTLPAFILLLLLLQATLFAADISAVSDGNWITPSTWDLGRVPQDNDVVIIPASRRVFFNGAPYPKNLPATRPTLNIKIYGILDFTNAGNDKLYLNAGSVIQIFINGKIQTSSSSSEIIAIYNGSSDNTVWDGTPATIHGPASATATSTGFSNAILPVELQSFTIKKDKKGFAKLNWITGTELNSLLFEIETLAELNSNWRSLAQINAARNSSSIQEYNYVVPLVNGENQFRLKQIDIDGKYTYSTVVSIKYNPDNVNVNYNQRSHQLVVSGAENNAGNLFIFDLSGRVFYKGPIRSSMTFNPGAPGIYFVKISSQISNTIQKIQID